MLSQACLLGLILLLCLAPGSATPATAQGGTIALTSTWTNAGPYGGYVRAVAVDPTDPDTVYAVNDGIFKSTDGGQSWRTINEGLTGLGTLPIAINPSSHTLFSSGRDSGTAIGYVSTDGGAHWQHGGVGAAYDWAIYPPNPEVMYAAGWWSGIVKSTDGGRHWQGTAGPFDYMSLVSVDPNDPDVVYASSPCSFLIKSSDGGAHWANLSRPNLSPCVNDVVVAPDTQSTVYAGLDPHGVIKSTDGGLTWSQAINGLGNLDVSRLVIHPQTPSTLYAVTAAGIYKTTNAAGTWSPIGSGLAGLSITDLVISLSHPATLYAGTATAGVFRSDDGGAIWHGSSSGYSGMRINAVVVGAGQQAPIYAWVQQYAGPRTQEAFRSDDAGVSWHAINDGLPGTLITATTADPLDARRVYAATGGMVFRSADSGGTWQVSTGLPGSAIQALAGDPWVPGTLYAGTNGNGVYKSADYGATWSAAGGLGGLTITGVAVAEYTGAPRVLAETQWGLYGSANGGSTWTLLNDQIVGGSILVVDPRVRTRVYTAGLRSSDGGNTWASMSPLPEEFPVQGLVISPTTSDVYVTGGIGHLDLPSRVFRSHDAGASWEAVSQGVERYAIYALAVDGRDPAVVYVGTKDGLFAGPDGLRPFSYALTTSVMPVGAGGISVSPAPNDGTEYVQGTVVTLTATASQGYRYTGWSGAVSGTANPAQLTVSAPFTVTANFEAQKMFYLPLLGRVSR